MRRGASQTEEEFGDIVVKTGEHGEVTRLRDVARIELGAADYALRSLLDNKPAVAIPIFQTPGSNAIQVSNKVRATMKELKKNFPDGVDLPTSSTTPRSSCAPRSKRWSTRCSKPIALVVLVVILFLQTWRASIIPLVAVPVSIVGTFAVMHAARLFDQCADAVRPRAGDRHRGRRRHRRGGKRRA